MRQLFDQIDLPRGGKGVVIHVYDGVMPPTYLVELFQAPHARLNSAITLQEQVDGTLRRLPLTLESLPAPADTEIVHGTSSD